MPDYIDKLTEAGKREAKRLSTKLENGEITADEWKDAMLQLLASSHIIAASVGRGGLSKMTDKDWSKVQRKIEWQDGYLDKFKRAIQTGGVIFAAGRIASRAASYLSAPYISYQSAAMEAATETAASDGKEIMVRLVTNAKESCSECAADEANGWVPIEDFGEIGSRICGDFCLCDAEFDSV